MTKREIIEAMDADAENPEITLEQFAAKVEEVNAKQNAENTFTNITKEDINNMIKEDKTMMNINEIKTTFVFENRTYTEKTNGYCFVTENGKTRRIKASELEQAFDSYIQAGADAAAQAELDEEPCMVEVENDLDKPAVLNEFGCVDCSKCNVEHCVHRDCMRRNPRSEGGLAECPRLHVKVEAARARTSDSSTAKTARLWLPSLPSRWTSSAICRTPATGSMG